jgi:hypothetical protein
VSDLFCCDCSQPLWHDSDLSKCLLFGRFRGQTGHLADDAKGQRLTHLGHCSLPG